MTPARSRIRVSFVLVVSSALIAASYLAVSWLRWATFQYRTFDLAFYVQALWNFGQGGWQVSLLNVPMLGNHFDLIVLPLVPLFALWPHPMLPVIAQVAALGLMPVVAFRIATRLGIGPAPAFLLALSTVLAPATGFVAIHEFHPEAFVALFLLLLIDARQRNSLPHFWLWFLATLSCKENMTLLLAAYCTVLAVTERRQGRRWLCHFCLWPALVALAWLGIYAGVLSPRWNGGNVEFLQLYSHLGGTPGEAVRNFFTNPDVVLRALSKGLQGNLLWGLLLPFCALPLLRPRWLLVAAPILFQHLLSNRSSEWTIYFHYAAPLIPLFWVATSETIAIAARASRSWEWLATAVFAGCVAGQVFLGPAYIIKAQAASLNIWQPRVERKYHLLQSIEPAASVVASLSFLSHLAEREHLYSLHHVLKGLKTLSRSRYQTPNAVDSVLIDYTDSATFDASASFYHPQMRSVEGGITPSSDRLLHLFLRGARWKVKAQNGQTLLVRDETGTRAAQGASVPAESVAEIVPGTKLISVARSARYVREGQPLFVKSVWQFEGERTVFPWLSLKVVHPNGNRAAWFDRGLCVPEGWSDGEVWDDLWLVNMDGLAKGEYRVQAVFYDNTTFAWNQTYGASSSDKFEPMRIVELGVLVIH